jgi:hypothetical protein
VDAFVGMVAEPHVAGTEFGELQLAIWKKQFQSLRDGDRFFHLNDPGLSAIRRAFGIDYRRTLSDLIADNTDIDKGDLRANVFRVDSATTEPASSRAPIPTNGSVAPAVVVTATPGATAKRRRYRR